MSFPFHNGSDIPSRKTDSFGKLKEKGNKEAERLRDHMKEGISLRKPGS